MKWITCNNPEREVWKLLSHFKNSDFARATLESRFPNAPPAQRKNIEKHCAQVRMSILQAEEYFVAARRTSITTSPNHLYYGIYALNTAIMLMRGGGNFALDRIRGDRKNRSHGLTATIGSNHKQASSELELMNSTRVIPEANGFFSLWHSTLPDFYSTYGITRESKGGIGQSSFRPVGKEDAANYADLSGRSVSCLELASRFPDLCHIISRLGKAADISRCTVSLFADDTNVRNEWVIHGASSRSSFERILDRFSAPSNWVSGFSIKLTESGSGGVIEYNCPKDLYKISTFSFPSLRFDRNYEYWMFAESLDNLEAVDATLMSFALSMLSRYYPDLWISCLESRCGSSVVASDFVELYSVRYPALALSLMLDDDTFVSPRQPPWH